MKKFIGLLILSIMLMSSVSFGNLETVEASTVKSDHADSAEFEVFGGGSGYISPGRPRPIDVY